jgi:hypothetical protein
MRDTSRGLRKLTPHEFIARQSRFRALVLGPHDAEPEITARVPILLGFRRGTWEKRPWCRPVPSLALLHAHDFSVDLRAGLSGVVLPPGSVVLGHMITAKHMLGLEAIAAGCHRVRPDADDGGRRPLYARRPSRGRRVGNRPFLGIGPPHVAAAARTTDHGQKHDPQPPCCFRETTVVVVVLVVRFTDRLMAVERAKRPPRRQFGASANGEWKCGRLF